MKRLYLAAALLALTPGLASAQSAQSAATFGPSERSHEFSLSGTGSNDREFDNGSFGVTGDYGYYLSRNLEIGARQSVNWAAIANADDTINASTRFAVDYHFDVAERWRPFVGLNVGAIYGDGVSDTGIAGPEIGVKYYVNPTTFIMLRSEYQFFFEDSDEIDNNFDDGAFAHTLGVGFNF
jgi:hypothetical protein